MNDYILEDLKVNEEDGKILRAIISTGPNLYILEDFVDAGDGISYRLSVAKVDQEEMIFYDNITEDMEKEIDEIIKDVLSYGEE